MNYLHLPYLYHIDELIELFPPKMPILKSLRKSFLQYKQVIFIHQSVTGGTSDSPFMVSITLTKTKSCSHRKDPSLSLCALCSFCVPVLTKEGLLAGQPKSEGKMQLFSASTCHDEKHLLTLF